MRKQRWIPAFLFLLLGGLPPMSDPSLVRIEMIPGFSGSYFPGSWVPLVVLLESPSAFEGEIRLSIPLGNPHLLQRSVYEVRRKVAIQPGSSQRIPFTVPLGRREDITVSLGAGDFKPQKKIFPLHPAPGGLKLVLGLSRQSSLGLDSDSGYRFQTIHPENLPVSTEGYSSLQAVVFHNAPLHQISPAGTEALIRWIYRGGVLVTLGEGGLPEQLGPALAPLMPLRLFGRDRLPAPPDLPGSDRISLPSAATYPVFRADPAAEARTLGFPVEREFQNSPMLQAFKRVGNGFVVTSLIDPAAAPYADWDGLGDYWKILLNPEAARSLPVFPLEDPLPNLHSQLSMNFPNPGGSEIPRGLIALAPLGLLLFFLFRKNSRPVHLVTLLIIPLATALLIFFLYPEAPEVYREIQVVRGNPEGGPVTEWVKGSISGRRGGLHRIQLPSSLTTPLPNRTESLILEEDGFGRTILISRSPWEDREFFFTAVSEMQTGAVIETDGSLISGFIPWDPQDGWEKPLLIGGSRAVNDGVVLHDQAGVSFKLTLGQGVTARERETLDMDRKVRSISASQRALLDYLITRGELNRDDTAPEFYLAAFSRSRPAYLLPEEAMVETESLLLIPVTVEARR